MRTVSSAGLLDVWEEGLHQVPYARARALLAAGGEDALDDLGRWSVGQLDAGLLALRESVFGPEITAISACPSCTERVELSFRVSDIRFEHPSRPPEEIDFEIDEFAVRFRLPRSMDLAAIAQAGCESEARLLLLRECLLSAQHRKRTVQPDELPDHVVSAISKEMARLDPQADVRLHLQCPSCENKWEACFDIVSFFWAEIHMWAQRVLRDVHILATVYHWSEADILAMSAARRQAYLGLVSG